MKDFKNSIIQITSTTLSDFTHDTCLQQSHIRKDWPGERMS